MCLVTPHSQLKSRNASQNEVFANDRIKGPMALPAPHPACGLLAGLVQLGRL